MVSQIRSELAFYVKKSTATLDFSTITWKPVMFEKPVVEFDFRGRQQNNQLAEILGFSPEKKYFDGYIYSDYAINTDHPPYLLLDLEFDNKSLTTIDSYQEKERAIFAKIQTITSGNFVREIRVYPMSNMFLSPRDITSAKVSILNPDHSLYNFHGKNFSLTFNLQLPFLQSANLVTP